MFVLYVMWITQIIKLVLICKYISYVDSNS